MDIVEADIIGEHYKTIKITTVILKTTHPRAYEMSPTWTTAWASTGCTNINVAEGMGQRLKCQTKLNCSFIPFIISNMADVVFRLAGTTS
jgi:hypothetical protein